ncbi:hypothetical protein LTR56_002174 [Elasticomyces elasticus]|nr:hypothetical protein LTR56_002174 [Elasticomyces elasticus]KAK3666053.1 hypothetical protein LTR22_003056 [Elasticomyces elasticus]KAK4929540.1 hypothetical protein LTR49_003835 [Elasticomyces elasticus]KAK5767502.1 hypothetical protein LTS12_002343 [Elasticomyces elasticus]
MARMLSPTEEVETSMSILCDGWRQVGPAFQFYENDDETALLYRFHNQWMTLDGWLPALLLRHLPPAYTLPKRFVIKVKKGGWCEMAIANEQEALQRMVDAQGHFVPRLLDQVRVEGMETSALAMELLPGKSLWELSEETWIGTRLSQRNIDHICRGIIRCFDAVAEHYMCHYDPELTNLMLVTQAPSIVFSTLVALGLCTGVALLFTVDVNWGARLAITALLLAMLVYLCHGWRTPTRVVIIDFEIYELMTDSLLHTIVCHNSNRASAWELCTRFRGRCLKDQYDA